MRTWLVVAGLLLFLSLPAVLLTTQASPKPPTGPAATPLTAEEREALFQDMWLQVNQDYLYFDRRTVDWDAVREKYLPLARNASSDREFRTVLKQALADVEDSHVNLIDPDGSVGRPHVWVEPDGDQIVIARVDRGSDAAKAGLKAGMVIESVDGQPVAEVWAREEAAASATMAYTRKWLGGRNILRGPFDSSVQVVAGFAGKKPVTATLKRNAQLDPFTSAFGQKRLPGGIVYIQVGSFADIDAIRKAGYEIRVAAEKKAPGLILDVRYNRGGSPEWAVDLGTYLFESPTLLGTFRHFTTGETAELMTRAPAAAYSGPVVLLTNQSCGSACDVFAAGLQQTKRAILVGENPCGAGIKMEKRSLGSGYHMALSTAWMLLDPNGNPIEQNPAQVDYRVAPTAADWAAGRDPVLEKALELLKGR